MRSVSRSFVLLHVSLSQRIVLDRHAVHPWEALSFYAAIDGMDSPESCLWDFLAQPASCRLSGWRIFSRSEIEQPFGRRVQVVTGFQPIVLSSEAIAFARSISDEHFKIADGGHEVWSGYGEVPQELFNLLADPRVPNSAHAREAD